MMPFAGEFSGFCHRTSIIIIIRYNDDLETFLGQDQFCGGKVNNFKRIIGKPYISDQFNDMFGNYNGTGCNMDIACRSTFLLEGPNAVCIVVAMVPSMSATTQLPLLQCLGHPSNY